MDRRVFLKNSAVLISTPVLATHADLASSDQRLNLGQKVASSPMEVESSISRRDIHIHEDFIRNNSREVDDLRKRILAGVYDFANPYLGGFYAGYYANLDNKPPEDNAWLLWAEQGEKRWLLAFNESTEPIPGADKEGFLPWLSSFRPHSCNDWLMVPTLYVRHVWDEDAVDWCIGPAFHRSTHHDLMLSVTRGVLLWTWQAERIVASTCGIPRLDAAKLWRSYCLGNQETIRRFDETPYDDRSLGTVIEERTLHNKLSVCSTDYVLAGFLSEHITMQ